ncbi:MAG: hypothetical protein H6724_13810 [Sandaracinus sp.]|nr:hypothetical protein [Sandaracinus sp.]MCB9625336.1 hypothetical protein [Sandaracinus sp.]
MSDPRCVDFVDTVVIGCDSSGIEREVRDESIAACSLMNDATIDACIACGALEACSMAVWSCIQAQCPFFSEE